MKSSYDINFTSPIGTYFFYAERDYAVANYLEHCTESFPEFVQLHFHSAIVQYLKYLLVIQGVPADNAAYTCNSITYLLNAVNVELDEVAKDTLQFLDDLAEEYKILPDAVSLGRQNAFLPEEYQFRVSALACF